jgi:cytochrome P450
VRSPRRRSTAGGYDVPAGAFVGSSTILTHSRPDLYPDPDAFRPERFQDGGADTYTWIPFGGGVRRCLGASFATFEMKVILRGVLERCDLGPPDGKPERPVRRFVTYPPNRGARVVLRQRSARPSARDLALD